MTPQKIWECSRSFISLVGGFRWGRSEGCQDMSRKWIWLKNSGRKDSNLQQVAQKKERFMNLETNLWGKIFTIRV